MPLHERDYFTEKTETKPMSLACPQCRHRDDYQIKWIRRTKKSPMPNGGDRAKYDKLATFTLGAVQAAARTPMDAPVGRWALAALRASAPKDVEPVRIRMMGGTVPTDVLVDALHLPFVLIPTVNADNNQHARDENLRMGNFVSGSTIVYRLLTTEYR